MPTKYLEPPGAIPCTLKRARRHAQQIKNARQQSQPKCPNWRNAPGARSATPRTPQAYARTAGATPKLTHVGERIELHAKFGVGAGHARESAIERIENDGDADGLCGVIEIFGCPHQCGDDRVISAEKVGGGHQRRNEKNSATESGLDAGAASVERDFLLIQVRHAQDCLSTAAKLASLEGLEALAGQRARTLEPPLTLSPIFTKSWEPWGTHRSTREPKRTRPMRSPAATVSCAFFQETTRRATRPAICFNSIFP